jgi:MFS family permease
MSQSRSIRVVNLRILAAVAFSAVAYFAVGLPLAILPAHVHLRLGQSPVLAGLMVSLQYLATFASRPRAGRLCDGAGPRRAVLRGLAFCAASGLLLALSGWLQAFLWPSLGLLALSRLALGTGESLTATGAIMWGIGRVGQEHTVRVISWNGVATYVALALGAPCGVLLASRLGFASVGLALALLGALGLAGASRLAATVPPRGKPEPLGRLVRGVAPFGLALALGGLGFGVIATFITLHFAQRHWPGAALSLTVFGLSFVGARLAFARCIDRYGGFAASLASFAVEAAGLLLLALGGSPGLAYLACGLIGLGFSLVFPALALEAARSFPESVRGSVLGIYSAFIDASMFLVGPLAGLVVVHWGYPGVFLAAAGAVLVAMAGTAWLAGWAGASSADPLGSQPPA